MHWYLTAEVSNMFSDELKWITCEEVEFAEHY